MVLRARAGALRPTARRRLAHDDAAVGRHGRRARGAPRRHADDARLPGAAAAMSQRWGGCSAHAGGCSGMLGWMGSQSHCFLCINTVPSNSCRWFHLLLPQSGGAPPLRPPLRRTPLSALPPYRP